MLFHWAFATCCPCVRESVLSCDDQSTLSLLTCNSTVNSPSWLLKQQFVQIQLLGAAACVWCCVSVLSPPGQDRTQGSAPQSWGRGLTLQLPPGPQPHTSLQHPLTPVSTPGCATLLFLLCSLDEEKRRKWGGSYIFW